MKELKRLQTAFKEHKPQY